MKVKRLIGFLVFVSVLAFSVSVVPYVNSQPEEEEEPIQTRPNPVENVIRKEAGADMKGKAQGKASGMLKIADEAQKEKGGALRVKSVTKGKMVMDDGEHGDGKVMDDGQHGDGKVMDDGEHGDGKVMDDGEHGDKVLKTGTKAQDVTKGLSVFNKKSTQNSMKMNMDEYNPAAGSLEKEFGGSMNIGDMP